MDENSQSATLQASATGNLYFTNNVNGGIYLNAGAGNQSGVHLYPSDRVELKHVGNKKFGTLGAGVTVTGTTFSNQLSVSGILQLVQILLLDIQLQEQKTSNWSFFRFFWTDSNSTAYENIKQMVNLIFGAF